MVKEILVGQFVENGRRLIEGLDQAGFPVIAAFWRFLPEAEEWRLFIASPKVNELGPLAAYATIQEALAQHQIDLPLHRVSVVSPEEPFVTDLRIFAGTDPEPFIGKDYLQNIVVGELYIEGAYVYRAERIIGKSGTLDLWLAKPDKSHKVWTALHAKAIFKDGFVKNIELESGDWPITHAKNGINAHLAVISNVEERQGKVFGNVDKWTILGGRLRRIVTAARDVPLQDYPLSSRSTS
jgi:hypothetical protein